MRSRLDIVRVHRGYLLERVRFLESLQDSAERISLGGGGRGDPENLPKKYQEEVLRDCREFCSIVESWEDFPDCVSDWLDEEIGSVFYLSRGQEDPPSSLKHKPGSDALIGLAGTFPLTEWLESLV